METFKQTLARLIAYPTISSESNTALIDYCAERLESVGARVQVVHHPREPKSNLFASLGPEGDDGIVLSGHSDVVPVANQAWSSDPFVMREEDGKLYGRGSCDMKGFIALALEAAAGYAQAPLKRPVHFAFTHDEETGCLGAQHLIDVLKQQGQKASAVIVGEPTMMKIIDGHKGMGEYTTHFRGLAGHSSRPELGVNCAEYAVMYINKLLELRQWLKDNAPAGCAYIPPHSTLNVGRINAGIAHNVIPDHATVDWEMRPVQAGEIEHVREVMAHYCETTLLPAMREVCSDAQITLQVISEVMGLQPSDENEAKAIIQALTGETQCGLVAFGTEAGLFQSLGMSAVVCGPGSIDQAHKPDEYLSLDQAAQCQKMLHDLTAKLI